MWDSPGTLPMSVTETGLERVSFANRLPNDTVLLSVKGAEVDWKKKKIKGGLARGGKKSI